MGNKTLTQDEPGRPDLEFFGKLTAGTTHELNNVMSIIEQVIGLLEDQLTAARDGAALDSDKLWTVNDRILKQLQRGTNLLFNLNRFAHTVDRGSKQTPLEEYLDMLSALTQRFANLARVQFSVYNTTSGLVFFYQDPFTLLEAPFQILMNAFEVAERDEEINLSARSGENDVTLEIAGPALGRIDLRGERYQRASELVEQLNGTMLFNKSNGAAEMNLPARIVSEDL